MSYLDWKVGDRVVCVGTAEGIARMQALIPEATMPESGGIYTIRAIRDDRDIRHRDGAELSLLLAEIDNRHMVGRARDGWKCYREPGFPLRGFRKVQPCKTDISIFTAMLHDQRQKERA